MKTRTLIVATATLIASSLTTLGADAAEDTGASCQLDVSSQPLDGALQEVARQCGVQVLYFSQITAGMTAAKLEGSYTVESALLQLLDKTGLTFRHVNATTIEIQRTSAAPAAVVSAEREPTHNEPLDEIVIRGTAEGLVATRIETPLRDIPQTISVVSQEQMRQQNNFSLSDVVKDVPGVTAIRQDSQFQVNYSRGFEVNSYTLDGGGSLRDFSQTLFGAVLLLPDMAEFDHVDVLRGANALFGANATPGGAINLVRKRPLHDSRVTFSTSGGSWNNFRGEIDATGPLALDGALRGRVGVSYREQEFFYDYGNEDTRNIFGVMDYDITPATTLTLGGSYTQRSARPFSPGLPLFSNGEDPNLPRDTAYIFDWSRFESEVGEAYARVEHTFGPDWKLKVHATSLDQEVDYLVGYFYRGINPVTGGRPLRPIARYTMGPSEQRQLNLDATLTGTTHWGDHAVEMAFGGDFLRTDSHSLTGQIAFSPPLANAFAFDPAVYPNPVTDLMEGREVGQEVTNILGGLFASLKFNVTQQWSLTAGLRVSNDKVEDHSLYYFGDFEFPLDFDYEYKNVVTPFLATVFTVNDHYSLYASYADVYLSNGGFERSDGSLLPPSHAINVEVGIKGAWRDGAVNAALALYNIDETGIALFDENVVPTEPECCFTTQGHNTTKGADLELTGTPVPGWVIGAGYTFNQTEQVTPGSQYIYPLVAHNPKHLFKLWTNYELPRGWSVGGSIQAQSDVHENSVGCEVLTSTGFCLTPMREFQKTQGSYVIVSPRIGYQFDDRWQVALNINNVFDRQYYESVGSPNGGNWYGEPRNFLIRLDARY